jgi:hypothetical protein
MQILEEPQMSRVMIDLETLGTRPGCSILSIGAVEFGPAGVKSSFYVVARRSSCRDAGLVEDPDTIAWWDKQLPKARDIIVESMDPLRSVSLGRVLNQFDFWIDQVTGVIDAAERKNLQVYGNGADFDLPILSEAYRRCGMDTPWPAYSGRCYRTLKNLKPNLKMIRSGTHHNALDDAKVQAEHCAAILHELGGW